MLAGMDTRRSGRRIARSGALLAILLLVGALAGCGTTTAPAFVAPPGGTYTSAEYKFTLTYPTGWKANVLPQPAQTIPLTVMITRTGFGQGSTIAVSTLTITVLNMSVPAIATSSAGLPTTPSLRPVTLGGVAGYMDAPAQVQIQGSTLSATHTNYYVVRGGYEYQIATDAISGEGAEPVLKGMLESLRFLP